MRRRAKAVPIDTGNSSTSTSSLPNTASFSKRPLGGSRSTSAATTAAITGAMATAMNAARHGSSPPTAAAIPPTTSGPIN